MEWGEDPEGATPLTEEQPQGLRPTWIATRSDLNDAEAQNILDGMLKWQRRPRRLDGLLDDKVIRDLHRDLFGDVWSWAGAYRRTDVNIGVSWYEVPTRVRDLTEDAKCWFADAGVTTDTAACWLHHRLVQIHPFPNGNGRHAREFTNLVLGSVGAAPFTWGRSHLGGVGDVRTRYLEALRAADEHDHELLLVFVRS
jgi:Fic-DOC domain mobile mystery protein B